MPWGRLDDGLYDHPKLDMLGRDRLPCVGLWTLAISWCNRRLTDGVLPLDRIRLLGGTIAQADRLVEVGMFDRHEEGYAVHDFLAFNDSRDQVEARREAAAERQRKHRSRSESQGESHSQSQRDSQRDKGVSHAGIARAPAAARPGPTRPNPDQGDSPQPPASGGPTGRRANGTSPRQVAKAEAARQTEDDRGRRYRREQRKLAYARGAITEAQRIDQDERDASLTEIPDRDAHVASLTDPTWLEKVLP